MILIDTREKPIATEKITDYFQQHKIPYDRTKLYIGDYVEFMNPRLIVDRKHSLSELATNCATKNDKERFRKELQRAKDAGATLVLLVEQNEFTDRGVKRKIAELGDIVLWESPHSKINGEQMYRTLSAWCRSYPLKIEFCNKRSTGKRICEILGVTDGGRTIKSEY